MSSHCNRYPNCGCRADIGTKCGLPDGHPCLLDNEEFRNAMGYPLLSNEEIDWEKTSEEKSKVRDFYEKQQTDPDEPKKKKPKRKYPSNYTPPKKRKKR